MSRLVKNEVETEIQISENEKLMLKNQAEKAKKEFIEEMKNGLGYEITGRKPAKNWRDRLANKIRSIFTKF